MMDNKRRDISIRTIKKFCDEEFDNLEQDVK